MSGASRNSIWDPQSEALRSWNKVRDKQDIVIEMNTGGGKTLIGVLMAQSLVNERAGQVLYVCPTIQLIEQARMRAEECGLEVATYYEGVFRHRSSIVTRSVRHSWRPRKGHSHI